MAGNKNPWRDIPTADEFRGVFGAVGPGTRRPQPPPVATHPLPVAALPLPLPPPPAPLPNAHMSLFQQLSQLKNRIDDSINDYHAVAKDNYIQFNQRITKLQSIATLAAEYVDAYRRVNLPGAKVDPGGHKMIGDQRDVWAASLAHRAAKKAGYLTIMEEWHLTAKFKYKYTLELSDFLRGLAAGGHVKNAGEKLHATPYATIEKIDPYHRRTFFFLDPDEDKTAKDNSKNLMGEAFLQYLHGHQWPGATNQYASFYEWLEYSPFCIGTPGLFGDAKFKNPPRNSYAGHDLTRVRVTQSKLEAEKLRNPGVWTVLNTSTLPESAKGPAHAAAFVWAADCNLYLHTHAHDFVHASVKQGKKIRCSGMLVAENGIVTYMSNTSGHYAPNAQSLYNLGWWLLAKKCVNGSTTVEIERGAHPLTGNMPFGTFLVLCKRYVAPKGLPYPQ